MDAKIIDIEKFDTEIIGKDYIYIPFYQRKYTWKSKSKNDQISILWDDLINFYKESKEEKFFLGIIIAQKTPDEEKFYIIDGQQRITTIVLLIMALRNHIESSCEELDTSSLNFGFIKNICFYNRDSDYKIIKKILENEIINLNDKEKESNYYKNYKFFKENLKKLKSEDDIDIKCFIEEILKKINFVFLKLDKDENQYKIFETINSKGKKLAISDLIKNYVSMILLDKDEKILNDFEKIIEYFYESYSDPDDKLVNFYRHLFAIEKGQLLTKNNNVIYLYFKEKFEDKEKIENLTNKIQKMKEWIKDLKESMIIYKYISNHNFGPYSYPLLKGNFQNFYHLMHVIVKNNSIIKNNEEELVINKEQEKNIKFSFKYLSKLVVYRTLVNFGRVEANRTYAKLSKDLEDKLKNNKNSSSFKDIFVEEVIKKLNNSIANYRMPNIMDVKNIDSKIDIYSKNRNNLKYILLSIEESMSRKLVEKDNELEIEHIFPQNDEKWKEAQKCLSLNNNDIEEMKPWLNTIGNLSLIDSDDNKRLSNKSFLEKWKLLREHSYFKLNKLIEKYDSWDVDKIKNRAKELIEKIEEIWGDDFDNVLASNSSKNLENINNKLFYYKEGYLFLNDNKTWYLKKDSIIYKFESTLDTYQSNINKQDKFISENKNNLECIGDKKYRLITDLVVSSPSFAATLVAKCGSADGKIKWKDSNDFLLDEYVKRN